MAIQPGRQFEAIVPARRLFIPDLASQEFPDCSPWLAFQAEHPSEAIRVAIREVEANQDALATQNRLLQVAPQGVFGLMARGWVFPSLQLQSSPFPSQGCPPNAVGSSLGFRGRAPVDDDVGVEGRKTLVWH